MQEAIETTQRSASKLRKVQRRFEYLQSGSKAGKVTRECQGGLIAAIRPHSSPYGAMVK